MLVRILWVVVCVSLHVGVSGGRADEVEKVEVMVTEGDSFTLQSGVTELQDDDLIMWTCDDFCVAKINTTFRILSRSEELELEDTTGSLRVRNAHASDSCLYKALVISGNKVSRRSFHVVVVAPLPVPVITQYCLLQRPSAEDSLRPLCLLVCEVENVSHVTLSWYKGESLFSSISVSDLSRRVSLPLEIQSRNDSYTCVLNNSIRQQNTHLQLLHTFCHTCSDSPFCCDVTQAVVRLVVSALVGVTMVVVLVFDIKSRRAEQTRIRRSGSYARS